MAATYRQNANLFEFIAANFPDIVSAAIDAKGYALTPEDVAAAVCFLACEDARFLTGQVLCCDGGRCM